MKLIWQYMFMRLRSWSVIFLLPLLAASVSADPDIDFNRDIRPILSDHCYACHGPDDNKRKAGLRLDIQESALKELKSGDRAIVPGDVEQSGLVYRVTSDDSDEIMPPPEDGKPLTEEQIDLLVRWVGDGAKWDKHWAFIAPEKPTIPEVLDVDWPENEVDRFILARQEAAGFDPAAESARATLIRRVTFDLTGLPPTPEEVDAFLADTDPDAYEKVVLRLLSSPHYGERMTLNWLDLARYADTSGYHFDGVRFMWLWRDWVIDSFNNNKPYDVFTVEQLAGDLLPDRTRDQRIATGFVRNNMTNDEGGADPDEYLNKYVADRVNTMGAVWLGMTVGCAECHDHKFDPLKTKEFFELYAFYHNVPEKGLDRIRTDNPPPRLPVPTVEQAMQFVEADFTLRDAEKTRQDRINELGETQEKWERETVAAPPVGSDTNGLIAHLTFDDTLGDVLLVDGVEKSSETVDEDAGDHSETETKFVRDDEPEFLAGRRGRALRFDGKMHLDLGQRVSFDSTNAFSYGVWTKIEGDGAILSKMEKGPGFRGFDLYVSDKRFEVHFAHEYPDDAIKVKTKAQFGGGWRHVLISYDGSGKAAGVHIYVDGKLRDVNVEKDGLKGSIANSEIVRIGSRNGDGNFTGVLDDLRFFDHELNEEDAALLMFEGMLPIVLKSRGTRSDDERRDLQRFYKENYAVDYLRAEDALAVARQVKNRLIASIPTSMIMEEMDPPRETFRLVRGDFRTKAERVYPTTPDFLPPIRPAKVSNHEGQLKLNFTGGESPSEDWQPDRLDLATWLVSPEHPLTARVTVNRYWAMFFGTGLVKTINDFGSQGEWPSHPDLLDWLAVRFRDGDAASGVSPWDVKALVRLIVTSKTYRQSVLATPEKRERDPYNRLLARSPRLQLDAEFVRDNALAISGLLNRKIGGASVKPYQPPGIWDGTDSKFVQDHDEDLYRRGMYVFWRRSAHYPSFATFDAPNREVCTFVRQRTQTPLQSLVLMNDPAFVECARGLAQRVMQEESGNLARRLVRAFRLTLGREPVGNEIDTLKRAYEQQLAHFSEDTEARNALLTVGESEVSESLDPAKLAAMTAVANVLLNLNETITR